MASSFIRQSRLSFKVFKRSKLSSKPSSFSDSGLCWSSQLSDSPTINALHRLVEVVGPAHQSFFEISNGDRSKVQVDNTGKMCYFETERFSCGDWRWGNFKEHCNKEYRMGETCGIKLVYATYDLPRECVRCDAVRTKLRRREKLVAQYTRWLEEGRNPASREKARQEIAELDEQIKRLHEEIIYSRNNVVNTSSRRRAGY